MTFKHSSNASCPEEFPTWTKAFRLSVWSFRNAALGILRALLHPNAMTPVAILCLDFPIAVSSNERSQMVVSFTLVNFWAAFAAIAQTLAASITLNRLSLGA